MPTNAFIGATKAPSERELSAKLGPAKAAWDQLISELRECGADGQEWGSSSKKLGWSLRVKRGGRVIVYLAPSEGCFLASFALGDRAMRATRTLKLAPATLKALKEAKRYAEGSAVRVEIRSEADVADVIALARVKIEP
jgi:hypothetical protein